MQEANTASQGINKAVVLAEVSTTGGRSEKWDTEPPNQREREEANDVHRDADYKLSQNPPRISSSTPVPEITTPPRGANGWLEPLTSRFEQCTSAILKMYYTAVRESVGECGLGVHPSLFHP